MSLRLIEKINKKKWWHKLPDDPQAYIERGLFCTWSYDECEIYGRPFDYQISVFISNPLIGTEEEVVKFLFGSDSFQMKLNRCLAREDDWGSNKSHIRMRFKLDKDMAHAARRMGYDSIIHISKADLDAIENGKRLVPIEPNILYPALNTDISNYLDGKDEYKPWYDALMKSLQIELEVIGGINATN